MSRVFFDTNILGYAVDAFDKRKQQIALSLLEEHRISEAATISTQVLQEFYVVATKKLRIAAPMAKLMIDSLSSLDIVTISPKIIHASIEIHQKWKTSFWDALIIVAAMERKCEVLFSEDLNHGQKMNGLVIRNPFSQ